MLKRATARRFTPRRFREPEGTAFPPDLTHLGVLPGARLQALCHGLCQNGVPEPPGAGAAWDRTHRSLPPRSDLALCASPVSLGARRAEQLGARGGVARRLRGTRVRARRAPPAPQLQPRRLHDLRNLSSHSELSEGGALPAVRPGRAPRGVRAVVNLDGSALALRDGANRGEPACRARRGGVHLRRLPALPPRSGPWARCFRIVGADGHGMPHQLPGETSAPVGESGLHGGKAIGSVRPQ